MPSVPMEMPSLTVMVPNTWGMAPVACSALPASCASSFNPRLQGVMVLYALATPTIGLSKSASLKPTARNIDRLGARSTPCVMVLLLRTLMLFQREVPGEALHRQKTKSQRQAHARWLPQNATSGDNGRPARRWRQNTPAGWPRFAAHAFPYQSACHPLQRSAPLQPRCR